MWCRSGDSTRFWHCDSFCRCDLILNKYILNHLAPGTSDGEESCWSLPLGVRLSAASAQCYSTFSGSRHHHVQARWVHQLRRWQRPEISLEQQLLFQFVKCFPHPVVPTQTRRLIDWYLNITWNNCMSCCWYRIKSAQISWSYGMTCSPISCHGWLVQARSPAAPWLGVQTWSPCKPLAGRSCSACSCSWRSIPPAVLPESKPFPVSYWHIDAFSPMNFGPKYLLPKLNFRHKNAEK